MARIKFFKNLIKGGEEECPGQLVRQLLMLLQE